MIIYGIQFTNEKDIYTEYNMDDYTEHYIFFVARI